MLGKRQFSLGYLLLEIFWIAATLGAFRTAVALPDEYGDAGALLVLAGVIAAGAAIGGVFGRMMFGAGLAISLAFLAFIFGLLMPAVMVA